MMDSRTDPVMSVGWGGNASVLRARMDSAREQEWERLYKSLHLQIPSDAGEAQEAAEQAVRNHVASRWLHLQAAGDAHALKIFSQRLDALCAMQGRDVPSAPHPPMKAKQAEQLVPAESASSPETSQKKMKSVPHEFRFLKVRDGVWTALLADASFTSVGSESTACVYELLNNSWPRWMGSSWRLKATSTFSPWRSGGS